MNIPTDAVHRLCPGATYADAFTSAFNHMAGGFGFTTPLRTAYFLATCAVESQGFTVIRENLHYTTIARLRAVWPKRFTSDAKARPYLRNAQGLANLVYGGRMGNDGPDDGWQFRGWGPPQITGKENTLLVAELAGFAVDVAPALRESIEIATLCGMALWQHNGVHGMADSDRPGVVRQAWNGGDNGLPEFKKMVPKTKLVLGI